MVGIYKEEACTNEITDLDAWKSGDGKRTVVYNAEGGFLQFPEGDIVYPVAWEKRGNEIIWAENETVYDNNGNAANFRIVKCTYKL